MQRSFNYENLLGKNSDKRKEPLLLKTGDHGQGRIHQNTWQLDV